MNVYVVLLRGINVGGRNSLPMKDLITLLEGLECHNVKTYVQSGNVVLQSSDNASELAKKIIRAIKRQYSFQPSLILLTVEELKDAIANNPYPEAESDPTGLHFGFLGAVPLNPDLDMLKTIKKKTERFQLINKVFYLYAPEGVARSKVAANSERLLGTVMTDRNWRTVSKIRELVSECGQ